VFRKTVCCCHVTWNLGIGVLNLLWTLLKTPSIHDCEFNLICSLYFRILCAWNRVESVLLKRSRQLLNLYSVGSEWLWSTGGMILAEEDGTSWTKTSPITSFVTTNPTYTGLDLNPGLRGERLVCNGLIPIGIKSDVLSERCGPASYSPVTPNSVH
jgi:hypothetical protein